MEQLKEIQDECLADDVEIPPEAVAWVPSEARAYFESGGQELPQIMAGFEGAEIRSFYELNQRQFESTGSDAMLGALEQALFKTTGDAKFKPDAAAQAAAEKKDAADNYGTRERKPHAPTLKYDVPQLGDMRSSARNDDDSGGAFTQ